MNVHFCEVTPHLLIYPASGVGHVSIDGGDFLLRAAYAEADYAGLVPGALGLLTHQRGASVT